MNVNISLKRPGFRTANKKIKYGRISDLHRTITNDEIKNFLKEKYHVSVGE